MVEKDEYGDYDAGDQGNAPHLKEMMKIRWNVRTLDHWDLYRIRLRSNMTKVRVRVRYDEL